MPTKVKIKNPTRYAVVYRTGGRDNYKWMRMFEQFTSESEAYRQKKGLNRAGYRTYVVKIDRFGNIPRPDTYAPSRRDEQSHYDENPGFEKYDAAQRKLEQKNEEKIRKLSDKEQKRAVRTAQRLQVRVPAPVTNTAFGKPRRSPFSGRRSKLRG